jgi:hypothetical protein
MKTKYAALILLMALFVGVFAPLTGIVRAVTTPPVVTVSPSYTDWTGKLTPGGKFNISVLVTSGTDAIWSGGIGIGYNAATLKVNKVDKGTAIGGDWLWMPGAIDSVNGYAKTSGWSCIAGEEPGWTGTDGEMVKFEFEVKAYCSPDVTLDLTNNTVGSPDKFYATSFSKNVGGVVSPITPVTVNDGTFHNPPPPPYGPTAVITVVTPPPYYASVTAITFTGASSLPGFDGNVLVPIDDYAWDFGDGSGIVHGVGQVHTYAAPGLYHVNLTVHAPVGKPPAPDYDTDMVDITVFAKAVGAVLDLYTDSYRAYTTGYDPPGTPLHYTPYNGTGPGLNADAYQPQDLVTLYAKVTYNDDPVQDKPVAFEVHRPTDEIELVRTVFTDANGIATLTFRIEWPCFNESRVFGTWYVYADADVANKKIEDDMHFKVGWIVTVHAIKTLSSTPPYPVQTEFPKETHMSFTFNVTNIAMVPVYATFVITVYGPENVPIGVVVLGPWKIAGSGIWCKNTEVNFPVIDLLVPKWAYVGVGQVFLNAYDYLLPLLCGVPYCPEASCFFQIKPP